MKQQVVLIGKQAFNAMRDTSVIQGLEFAQVMVPPMASTHDAKGVLAAFQEKRSPVWTGS